MRKFSGILPLLMAVLLFSQIVSCAAIESIFVKDIKPKSIKIINTIADGSEYLEPNSPAFSLQISYDPENVSDKYKQKVVWGSDNSKVIECTEAGTLTPKAPGKARITATLEVSSENILTDVLVLHVVEKSNEFSFELAENETEKAVITEYRGYAESIVVPSQVVIDDTVCAVVGIGARVFSGSPNPSKIVEVILPDTIETIGNGAFEGCSSLSAFKTPSSLKIIGSYGFADCASLTSFLLPAGMTEIGASAFSGCSKLVELDNQSELEITQGDYDSFGGIGGNLLSIINSVDDGEEASKLKKIGRILYFTEEDDSLTAISADGDVVEIKGFDSTCSTIKDGAFSKLNKLLSVDMTGSNIVKIGARAFADCPVLESVIISGGVEEIGECIFEGSNDLKSLTAPFVGKYADPNSKENVEDRWIFPFGYFFSNDLSGKTYKTHEVSQFKPKYEYGMWEYPSFSYYIPWSLESVTITGTSNLIGVGTNAAGKHGVFENCSDIKSLSITGNLTSIGEYTFRSCTALKSISLPASLTDISQNAFEGCCFESVSYQRSGQDAGKYEFVNGKLKVIGLPAVGVNSKWYSDGLDPLVLEVEFALPSSDSSSSLTSNCFKGCCSLKNFILPEDLADRLRTIGDSAFEGCSSLEAFSFPDKLSYIGRRAFAFCESLTSVRISSISSEIDDGAFGGCVMLEEIVLPFVGDCKVMPGANYAYHFGRVFGSSVTFRDFRGGPLDMYVSYEVSQSNQNNGDSQTYYIPENLSKVTIMGESVGHGAFDNCKRIRKIVLEEGVPSIGSKAFTGCDWLDYVIIPASCATVASGVFRGSLASNTKIYLKSGDSADLSNYAEGWNDKDDDSKYPFYYFKASEPTSAQKESGKRYWHYGEDGEPVIWT